MTNTETLASAECTAQTFAENEQWNDAAKELLRVAKAQPRNAARWLQIAQWQRRSGDAVAAARTIETALKLNARRTSTLPPTDDIALRLALAEAQLEAQNWKACQAACRALLDLSPSHHLANELLATALLQAGDLAGAEIVMNDLLMRSPRDPLHRLRLATLLQMQGKLGDATREFERVLQLHPDFPVTTEAREAMESLDHMQTQQVLMLASERLDFRRLLETNIEEALDSLNFYLSANGLESLQHTVWDGSFSDDAAPVIH